MAAICFTCTTEEQEIAFIGVKQLFAHTQSEHTSFEGLVQPKPQPPGKTTPSATELKQMKLGTEKIVQNTMDLMKDSEVQHEFNEPIVLKYKFEGQCATCKRPVETIEVEVGEYNVVTPYCINCKKQEKQIKVIPISKQFVKEVKEKGGH